MTADATTGERIGLDWLRAALASVGSFGRRHDERLALYGPGDEDRARAEIADVLGLAERLNPDGVGRVRAALRAVPDPGPILGRARAGDPLDDVDFYELGRFVDALAAFGRAWDAAVRPAQLGTPEAAGRRPPSVDALRDLLAPGREGAGFYLATAFAPGLEAARAALTRAEAEYDARRAEIAERVRAHTGIDVVGDEFVVMRDVFDGPLPEGVVVVREAPAYRTAAIRTVTAERETALERLALEEEGARRALAERVAREAAAVGAATAVLGEFDRALARVAFTQRWGGCVPEFAPGRVAFADAAFAPLAAALAARGHRYTPLSMDVRGVAILTGPNMGGKSAALATAGFLCACAALGVPPPAREASLPLGDAIVWIGGEGHAERERLLSSYAAEVVRARDALAAATPHTLVLVDEFARTTGPREGRALLIAFVEALTRRGVCGIVATHFEGVGGTANVVHLRIAGLRRGALAEVAAGDLDAALLAVNAAMDYRVVAAQDGNPASDALSLALLLGLDPVIAARAKALHDDP